MVKLAEHVVAAEGFLHLLEARFDVSRGEVEELASVLGDRRESRPGLALGLAGMGQAEQAAEVGVAAQVTGDEDQLLAINLQRAADDRLDAELSALLQVSD